MREAFLIFFFFIVGAALTYNVFGFPAALAFTAIGLFNRWYASQKTPVDEKRKKSNE